MVRVGIDIVQESSRHFAVSGRERGIEAIDTLEGKSDSPMALWLVAAPMIRREGVLL